MDAAIEDELLRVFEPGAIEAALEADQQKTQRDDEVLEALKRDLEAARYTADKAFRQFDAADPANRLVAADTEPDRLALLPRQRRWASAGFGVA